MRFKVCRIFSLSFSVVRFDPHHYAITVIMEEHWGWLEKDLHNLKCLIFSRVGNCFIRLQVQQQLQGVLLLKLQQKHGELRRW